MSANGQTSLDSRILLLQFILIRPVWSPLVVAGLRECIQYLANVICLSCPSSSSSMIRSSSTTASRTLEAAQWRLPPRWWQWPTLQPVKCSRDGQIAHVICHWLGHRKWTTHALYLPLGMNSLRPNPWCSLTGTSHWSRNVISHCLALKPWNNEVH